MNTKHIYLGLLGAALVFMAASCSSNQTEGEKILKQSDFPAPPVAEVHPDTFVNFGKQRIDNYYWMKDKTNPKVIEYIKAENAYTDTVMASTRDLQQKIYDEILGRIKEDALFTLQAAYPPRIDILRQDDFYYYSRTEKGKQYRTYCRRKGSMDAPEEVIFDVNKLAAGKQAFIFRGYIISPDNSKAAYFYNETGSYAEFTMKVRDLASGQDVGFTVEGAASVAWANDNRTLFYSAIDHTLRSSKIFRRELDAAEGTLVYEEKDAKFSTYVSATKTKQFIFITCGSSTTSDERYISADRPTDPFKVFLPRTKDVEYNVYAHADRFFIRYKDKEHLNGLIYEAPLTGYEDRKTWKEFLPYDKDVRIEALDVLKDYVALELRKNGLNEIRIKPIHGGETKTIAFPEPVYTVSLGRNPEYDATTIRYTYTSLNRPSTLYEYAITDGKTTKLKEQEVPSGFNPDDYVVERLWATAPDTHGRGV